MNQLMLQRYAPHALALVHQPVDTGNPNQDFVKHLEKYPERRIDIEDTILLGGSLIAKIEPDLGYDDREESGAKILTLQYAVKTLGEKFAPDFIRYVKVIAGEDAFGRTLQTVASHYYNEIERERSERILLAETQEERDHAESEAIEGVLLEMSLWALRLDALTMTVNDCSDSADSEVADFPVPSFSPEREMSRSDRNRLFMERAAEVLGETTQANLFEDEMRFVKSKIRAPQSSGFGYDEEAGFNAYLSDLFESENEESLEAIQTSHDAVTEQYDENGAVSLHMSDNEKTTVVGSIDDDVDESYLPVEARSLAGEIRKLYINGEEREIIDDFINLRLNQIYGDPSRRENRVTRTSRITILSNEPTRKRLDHSCHNRLPQRNHPSPIDVKTTSQVYPNWDVRTYVTDILEHMLTSFGRDFHLNAMRCNSAYKGLYRRIRTAASTTDVVSAIKEAYSSRQHGEIPVRLFTALNTVYQLQRARLENAPNVTERDGKKFVSAAQNRLIRDASFVMASDLKNFATQISALELQDRECVRRTFRRTNPTLYTTVLNRVNNEICNASQKKCMFFRFAFFENMASGLTNKPDHVFHTLTAKDKAAMWNLLKEKSHLDPPAVK